MKKETPEETHKRCCELVAQKHFDTPYIKLYAQEKWVLSFEISVLYHYERIKIESPTDQDIEREFANNSDCYAKVASSFNSDGSYLSGSDVVRRAVTIEVFKKIFKKLINHEK